MTDFTQYTWKQRSFHKARLLVSLSLVSFWFKSWNVWENTVIISYI